MKRIRTLFVLLSVGAALLPAQPVGAKGPDASKAPRTSGPLVGSPLGCEDNGPAGRGEFKSQSCAWHYELAPVDQNINRDFGAYWIQMEADPGPGWCAYHLGFALSQPEGARILSVAPRRTTRIEEQRSGTTRLVVDGGGAASLAGSIEQDVLLSPRRIKVEKARDHYRFRWSGKSRDKVVVAIGIELAHSGPVPNLYSWMNSVSVSAGPCRTQGVIFGGRHH